MPHANERTFAMNYVSMPLNIDYTLFRGKKTRDYSHLTLGEALDKFVKEREVSCSPSTLARYDEYHRYYFCDITDVPLNQIDNDLIQEKIDRLAVKYAPKTVRNAYNHLHSVLDEFLPDRFWRVQLPPLEPNEFYIPVSSEVKELISEADDTILIPILLAAFGGLRRSEVCGLQKSDFTKTGVHIRRAVVYDKNKKPCIKLPKTKAGYRFVPLPGSVIFMAMRWKNFGMLPNTLTRKYERTIRSLDVPHFSYHKLRHYWASMLHEQGVPDQWICKIGGWKSTETLHKIYAHTLRDAEQKMYDSVVATFSEKLAG